MKKLILLFIIIASLTMNVYAQDEVETEAPVKYICLNTEFNPYIEGGYFLAEDIALTGGLGFYHNGTMGKTYFMLKGGIDKFMYSSGHIKFYTGGAFSYEANPNTVGRGHYESLVRVDGHFGGWIKLTRHLNLDGKVGVNLDFCDSGDSSNKTNFGIGTSSIGLVITF